MELENECTEEGIVAGRSIFHFFNSYLGIEDFIFRFRQ